MAALLSREFGVRPAPVAEPIKGSFGGLLTGAVAMLMIVWYLVAAWNQEKQQVGVLKF